MIPYFAHERSTGAEQSAKPRSITGAWLYGCGAIYGTRFSHPPPTVAAAGTMIWPTLFLVPASLARDAPRTLRPSAGAIAAGGAQAVFGTGVALLIYFRLVKTLGSMGWRVRII